jgi:hypothetical protein
VGLVEVCLWPINTAHNRRNRYCEVVFCSLLKHIASPNFQSLSFIYQFSPWGLSLCRSRWDSLCRTISVERETGSTYQGLSSLGHVLISWLPNSTTKTQSYFLVPFLLYLMMDCLSHLVSALLIWIHETISERWTIPK